MNKFLLGGISSAALLAAMIDVAAAADTRMPTKAPILAATVPNWNGFYIGVNGGYGWGHDSFDDPLDLMSTVFRRTDVPTPIGGVSPKGAVFGGHAGYNWQYSLWLAGVEGDVDGANINGTATASATSTDGSTFVQHDSTKFDLLASLRARVGVILGSDLLLYGTGGAAFGHTSHAASVSETASSTFVLDSYTADQSHFGWAGGGGVEGKLTMLGWSNLTLRAEYLHYDLGRDSTPFVDSGDPLGGFSISHRQTVDVVRGGLTLQFAAPAASVAARY